MDSSTARRIECRDKEGVQFELGPFDAGDMDALLSMYMVFSPRPASQGLPPEKDETCRRWVIDLVEMSENVLAWRDGRVIGHASINPDHERRDSEFVIFVHQDFRGRGIGNELTRWIVDRAREMGLGIVWLTVDTRNFKAIRLYQKHWFRFTERDATECVMQLDLP